MKLLYKSIEQTCCLSQITYIYQIIIPIHDDYKVQFEVVVFGDPDPFVVLLSGVEVPPKFMHTWPLLGGEPELPALDKEQDYTFWFLPSDYSWDYPYYEKQIDSKISMDPLILKCLNF